MSNSLSYYLTTNKSNLKDIFSNNKITLNYTDLKLIGYNIDEKITNSITKLYLSNNKISDLTGIEAFINLTHLSLANNEIFNFEELIKLPTTLISLSIKGNFVEKNPNLYLLLLQRFRRLQEIDGFKISEETRKTIASGKELRMLLIPCLSILENLNHEAIKAVNLVKINLEINGLFGLHREKGFSASKIESILLLFKKLGINIDKETYLSLSKKYLKSNINPSVYIIIKLFACIFKSKLDYEDRFNKEQIQNDSNTDYNDYKSMNSFKTTNTSNINNNTSNSVSKYFNSSNTPKINVNINQNAYLNRLNKNTQNYNSINTEISPKTLVSDAVSILFTEESRIQLSSIWKDLFSLIIKKYIIKSNYNSLPTFLNYLILKSNKDLEMFIVESIKSDTKYFDYSAIIKMNDTDLYFYIAKNLDKLFIKYTNRGADLFIKLQLMQFYLLDPANAHLNSLMTNEKKISNINSKTKLIIENNNELRHVDSPFGVRLNKGCDIFPNRDKSNTKITFVESDHNLEYDYNVELLNIKLSVISSNKEFTGKKNTSEFILNVDALEVEVDKFLYNFPILEFPIFSLNFDYMRILTSVLQDKIKEYVECFEEVGKVFDEIEKLGSEYINKYKSGDYSGKFNTTVNKSLNNTNRQNTCNPDCGNYKSKDDYFDNSVNNQYNSNNNIYIQDEYISNNSNNNHNNTNTKQSNTTRHNTNNINTQNPNFSSSSYRAMSNYNFPNESNTNRVVSKRIRNINLTIKNKNISTAIKLLNNVILIKNYKLFLSNIITSIIKDKYIIFTKRIALTINKNEMLTKSLYFKRLINSIQSRYKYHQMLSKSENKLKKKYFSIIKVLLRKQIIIKKHMEIKLRSKAFFSLAKNYYDEKFEREKTSNARVFYFRTLIKKVFNLFKFNKFLKPDYSNIINENERVASRTSLLSNSNYIKNLNDEFNNKKNNLENIDEESSITNNNRRYSKLNQNKNITTKETRETKDSFFDTNITGNNDNQNNNLNNPFTNAMYSPILDNNQNNNNSYVKSKSKTKTSNNDYNVEQDLDNLLNKLQTHLAANSQNKIKTKNQIVNAVFNTNQSNINLTTNNNDNNLSQYNNLSKSKSRFLDRSILKNTSRSGINDISRFSGKVERTALIGHPSYLKKTSNQVFKEFV